MKLAFLLLVLANLALFGWQQGAFGTLPDTGREPGRVANQIEPERIRVLSPTEVQQLKDKAREQAARQPATPAAFSLAALDVSSGQGCVELGDFGPAELTRVRARLDALALGERLASRGVDLAGWTMVYVPPFKTRAEAERTAGELRKQGVRDLAILAEPAVLRHAVALGSFKEPELAKAHLSDLEKRGVKGARLAEKPAAVPGQRFVIKGLDVATLERLQALQKDFPQSKFASCTP